MTLREIIPVFIISLCIASPALAQEVPPSPSRPEVASVVDNYDFSKTVFPITELKLGIGIKASFGTGFCLDPACRFIGTDYHVAAVARLHKIKGEKVIRRYLATGPDDQGATVNTGPSTSPMKFNPSRDLAVFELRRPLLHHHGASYSLDDLHVGQEIDLYAYPKDSINPSRHLRQFHGKFIGETTTGLLAFAYDLSADRMIRPGASGGIVVDSKTQKIVGILSQIESNGESIAMAVAIQPLVEFVSKIQPFLAQKLFPSTGSLSPVSADFYPSFAPSLAEALQRRPEEPAEVKLLRNKAQMLADNMRNFIAVQSFAWGSGDNEPAAVAAYEVQVVGGHQRFREYPDGKKEVRDLPLPPLNVGVFPGDEWSELPQMVGTRLRLKIHQAPDVTVNGRRMKVFQYRADVEDDVCAFTSITDYLFFTTRKTITVACYGEVWTDEDTNILRMSEHYEPCDKWKNFQVVVTYGWLKRSGQAAQLIPLTITTEGADNKRIYWCRGHFTEYRMFDSQVRLIAN